MIFFLNMCNSTDGKVLIENGRATFHHSTGDCQCVCGKSQVHLIQSVSVCPQAWEKKINTSGNLKEFGSMSSGVAIVYKYINIHVANLRHLRKYIFARY